MTTDLSQVGDSTSWLALIDVASEELKNKAGDHNQQEDLPFGTISRNMPKMAENACDLKGHQRQNADAEDNKGKPHSVINHRNNLYQQGNPLTISLSFLAETDDLAMELTLHPSQNDLNLVEEDDPLHSNNESAPETTSPMPNEAVAVMQEASAKIPHRRNHNAAARRRRRQRQAGFPPPGCHAVSPAKEQQKRPNFTVPLYKQDQDSCPGFMFIAVQSDPYIMYRDDELGFDERVKRSINSTFGMTVIALNHTDPLNLHSEGLCMRTKWARMDKRLYSSLRPRLIFRDKFCNYRNFREMKPHVKWSNTTLNGGSVYHPFGREYSYDGQVTTFPTAVVNSMSSTYQFLPIAEFDHPEIITTVTPPPSLRLQRFAGFYREILRFIIARAEGAGRITLYHRLPLNMLWLVEDMGIYAASMHHGLMINFIKMHGNASNPHISAHCLHRANHNTVVCEICLFEAYLPQLLDEVNAA